MPILFFFFFNDTATTEIYTLSLHDALPILSVEVRQMQRMMSDALSLRVTRFVGVNLSVSNRSVNPARSEEHTSELQSQSNLVCRLLLEKKKKSNIKTYVLR